MAAGKNPRGARADDGLVKQSVGAAAALAASGRIDEAVRGLEGAGRIVLGHPVAQNLLGGLHLQKGRHREALKAFDAAIKSAPGAPEAHCNRGVALQELGRREEALAAYGQAIRLRRAYPLAHFNRDNVLKELGRTEEALAAYDEALRLQPAFPEAHLNRGTGLVETGNLLAALDAFAQALASRPGYIQAQIGRASALRELGRLEDALAASDAVLARDPANADALLASAQSLIAMQRNEDALIALDRLIGLYPANAKGHMTRATALRKLRRFEEGLAAAEEAVRAAPADADAHVVSAVGLGDLGRYEEQREALQRAAKLGASGYQFHHARANALYELGDLEGAIAAYAQAIRLRPGDATIRYYASFPELALGHFEKGWAGHQHRLDVPELRNAEFDSLAPRWRGEDDIAGKKILVYPEQGSGDTIQFVRYLQLLKERGAEISFILPPTLKSLLAPALEGIDAATSLGLRSGFDYQVSLASLPHAFATRLETIPQRVPYLFPDSERVLKWRGRLGSEGFKIGIAWQGNPNFGGDRFRSIPLSHYAPLAAIPGVRLISLQAVRGLDQLARLPSEMRVETLGREITDNPDGFAEIAAVMANLDLIVSSDTAVAHLAGALGRPVFAALTFRPDWRWLAGRSDSPWYPSMRLFRQKVRGDWGRVFAEIARAVEGKSAGL
jgi:tetratricopeptide (TPR) repeat protein